MLTEKEKVILKNTDKKWRYIARNKGNALILYSHKPSKNCDLSWWAYNEEYSFIYFFIPMNMFNHLFKSVQWEDDEPLEFRNENGEFIL